MRIGETVAYALATLAMCGCGAKVAGTEEDPAERFGDASAPCIEHSGPLVLETREDVVSAANVGVVDGDLVIVADEPYEISAEDLRCLTAVRGAVMVGSESVSTFTSINLGALETIDDGLMVGYVDIQVPGGTGLALPRLRRVGTPETAGGVIIGEASLLDEIGLPALEEVHGRLMIGWLNAKTVDVGALRTVSGSLSLGPAAELRQLELGQLEHVGGDVDAKLMPYIPYSLVLTIGSASEGVKTTEQVGCARSDGDRSPDCENP